MRRSLVFVAPNSAGVWVAKGTNRHVYLDTVTGVVTVVVPLLRWWAMPKNRRDQRPRKIFFPVWAIRKGHLRTASWWRQGELKLDVPGANDPYGWRVDTQRAKNVFPTPNPHKVRFKPKHQAWFYYLAKEIGLDE